MNSDKRYLTPNITDQKRLQREFDDKKIEFGFNSKNKRNEVWYSTSHSPPYMIAVAHDVSHALRLLRQRAKFDKMRAIDMLRKIDENNEALQSAIHGDAMYAIRSDLRNVAAGRKFYT